MTICNILALRYSDCKKEINQTSDPIEIKKLEDELKILEKIINFKRCIAKRPFIHNFEFRI